MAIVDKPWDGSPGRFTDEQYQKSCVLDRKTCGGNMASAPPKTRCSLPIKEPNGDLNKNGVHAAASRIGSVTNACPAAISAAKAALRSAYKTLGEDPPSSISEGKVNNTDEKKNSDVTGRHRERALAVSPGEWELRDTGEGEGDYLGILTGHFAVFNRWTEIDSFFEGRFLEQIAPGAFTKTFDENRKGMRVLLNHGRDPSVGMKPLGPIRSLDQDETGARYDVGLLDTTYNRDLLPGLKANQYGASFRFQVIREDVNTQPERSDHNPEGIEERTIVEAKVREFGPVTFPAYEDATAGMRSLNDQLVEYGARDGGFDLGLFIGADPELMAEFLSNLRSGNAIHRNGSQKRNAAPSKDQTEEKRQQNGDVIPPAKARLDTTPRLPSAARKTIKTSNGIKEVPRWRM